MSAGKKRTRSHLAEQPPSPAPVPVSPAPAAERNPKARKVGVGRGKAAVANASAPSSPAANSPPPAAATPGPAESKPSASPSAAPATPTLLAAGGEFVDPKDKVRGYVGTFNWKQHYPFGEVSPSVMQETPLVPSIPTLFYHAICAIQQVERETRGRDILPEIDKKIARAVEKGSEKKAPVVTGPDGTDYVINACRKEHVKLFFEGTDGGLLARLGLCPRLIEVFTVSPGAKDRQSGQQCVGGYNVDPTLLCTCSASASAVKARPSAGKAAALSAPATPSIASSIDDQDADLDPAPEDDGDAKGAGDDEVKSAAGSVAALARKPAVDKARAKPARRNDLGAEPAIDDATGMEMDSDDEDLAGNKGDKADRDVDDLTAGDHWGDLEKAFGTVRKNIEKLWRQKLREAERQNEVLKSQLVETERRLGETEQRFKEEKDVNVKLWEKLEMVNKTVDRMVKPLKKLDK